MTIVARRIIYTVFILIFLLAAPAVLLYTAGYNYNFTKGMLQKTGVLMVNALPNDAHISLDGHRINLSLPARISNLKPKDYTIKIERDGFSPWTKTLSIGSGETIYATNVFLPRQASPKQIFTGAVSAAAFLEKSNQFILVVPDGTGSRLIHFDAITKQPTTLVSHLNSASPQIVVSPNEKYLIVTMPLTTLAVNLSKPASPLNLTGKTGPLRDPVFEDGNDFVIYAKDGDTVIRRNLITNEQTVIYTVGKSHFLVANEFLYWTASSPGYAFELRRVALSGTDQSPKAVMYPSRGTYTIGNVGGDILLLEQNTRIFTLIDPLSFSEVASGELTGQLPPANQSWLYWNSSEVWIKNLKETASNLIIRIGEPIIKALEMKKEPYVLYATPGSLSLIEEDNRNTKNIYSLATLPDIRDFFLKTDNKVVYLVTRAGLFELPIQ